MSAPRWSEQQLLQHEYKLARKGIILHDRKPENKYRNKIVEAHGRKFDSKKEAARYNELLMMERAGIITNLECQKRFILRANGQIICSYISDFAYLHDGKEKVEDVKSAYTRKMPVYRLKKKMMQVLLGIEIIET